MAISSTKGMAKKVESQQVHMTVKPFFLQKNITQRK